MFCILFFVIDPIFYLETYEIFLNEKKLIIFYFNNYLSYTKFNDSE